MYNGWFGNYQHIWNIQDLGNGTSNEQQVLLTNTGFLSNPSCFQPVPHGCLSNALLRLPVMKPPPLGYHLLPGVEPPDH